jgi:uncharacterized protein
MLFLQKNIEFSRFLGVKAVLCQGAESFGFYYNHSVNLAILKNTLSQYLLNEKTGHGFDHLERVLRLAEQFSKRVEVNHETLTLIALLHDVDDYKLSTPQTGSSQSHASRFMKEMGVDEWTQQRVIQEIARLGFNHALENIRPITIEGQLVSDADMCDAIGEDGLSRVRAYGDFKHQPFFIRDQFPNLTLNAEQYRRQKITHSINHFFEKLLRLKGMMLTHPGKQEAQARHAFMIRFLRRFFKEADAPEWIDYLQQFLKTLSIHT